MPVDLPYLLENPPGIVVFVDVELSLVPLAPIAAVDMDPAIPVGKPPAIVVAQAKSSGSIYPKLPMRTWGNFKMTDEAGYEKVFTWCEDVSGSAFVSPIGDVLTLRCPRI